MSDECRDKVYREWYPSRVLSTNEGVSVFLLESEENRFYLRMYYVTLVPSLSGGRNGIRKNSILFSVQDVYEFPSHNMFTYRVTPVESHITVYDNLRL